MKHATLTICARCGKEFKIVARIVGTDFLVDLDCYKDYLAGKFKIEELEKEKDERFI